MRSRILIALTAAVLAEQGIAQAWLRSPQMYDGIFSDFYTLGDEDGDGDQDVISFEQTQFGGFRVWWNDGSGGLTPGPVIPSQHSPSQAVYAQITGGPNPDVVYPTSAGNTSALILHPGIGNGLFGTPITIPVPGNGVWKLASGDADGDGPDDLAIAFFDQNYAVRLAWIVSNGGAFTINVGPIVGFIDALVVLDLDGDSIDDIAVAVGGVVIAPTVAATPTLGASLPGLTGFSYDPALCAGDVDGDGDPDLISGAWTGYTVALRKHVNTAGTFTSGPVQTFSLQMWGRLYAGDIDGDGRVDLAFRGSDWLTSPFGVFANDGAGTFALAYARYLHKSGQYGGTGFADMNGDGKLDFVGSSEIHFGDGTFTDPLGGPALGSAVLRDWEGDGDLDGFLPATGLLRNDGRGVFTSEPIALPPLPASQQYELGSLAADFNGDGITDYLAALNQLNSPALPNFVEMRLFLGNADGTVIDAGPAAPPGVGVFGNFALDVDLDLDLDIIGAAGLFLNNGLGFFNPIGTQFSLWNPVQMRDLDGDGDQDFLAIPYPATSAIGVAILRRTSPATYTTQVLLAPIANIGLAGAPSLADVDGDGDFDITLDTDQYGNAIVVWPNVAGVYGAPFALPLPGPHDSGNVIAADVDADGLMDLVFGASNRIRIHRCVAAGLVYEPPRHYAAVGSIVRVADVDNDGDPDFLGGAIVVNRRWYGPSAGFSRQYGLGSAGSGGFRPTIGLSGPSRPGTTETLHVSRGLGGASALVVAAAAEANIPNFGAPGLTAYVANFLEFLPLTLGGTPGAPGAGEIHIPFGPLPPSIAGFHLYLQAALADPGAASGLSHTNGLEALHGL